jgi:hypothetical protein
VDYYYGKLMIFSINEVVYQKWTNYIDNYNFDIESGGIIVGKLNPAEKQVIATDITEPQQKDKCTKNTYKRAEYGHQEIMDNLWKESEYVKTYIGEWHTHNQRVPHPSWIDQRNWLQISKRRQNSIWLFFVIVGTEQLGVWTVIEGKIVKLEIAK